MSNPETGLQRAVLDAVNASGLARMWRQNTGAMKGGRVRFGLCKGSSDLIGLSRDGKFVAIEVKVPGKVPNDWQLKFLDDVRSWRGIGIWCDSVEGCLAQLNELIG